MTNYRIKCDGVRTIDGSCGTGCNTSDLFDKQKFTHRSRKTEKNTAILFDDNASDIVPVLE